MPVLDHPVHPSTISGERYDCNKRPRTRNGYWVPDGYEFFTPDRYDTRQVRTNVFINDFGSLECRYDHSLTDKKCVGCHHAGTGEAYAASIRGN